MINQANFDSNWINENVSLNKTNPQKILARIKLKEDINVKYGSQIRSVWEKVSVEHYYKKKENKIRK